jgi:hypothetical protein
MLSWRRHKKSPWEESGAELLHRCPYLPVYSSFRLLSLILSRRNLKDEQRRRIHAKKVAYPPVRCRFESSDRRHLLAQQRQGSLQGDPPDTRAAFRWVRVHATAYGLHRPGSLPGVTPPARTWQRSRLCPQALRHFTASALETRECLTQFRCLSAGARAATTPPAKQLLICRGCRSQIH